VGFLLRRFPMISSGAKVVDAAMREAREICRNAQNQRNLISFELSFFKPR
jgi:acetylornithine/succinyldiaminopimelate/putrescine aminotransferase